MNCWICCKTMIHQNEYNYLPEQDDTFNIPKIKNTFEIKIVDNFIFLYYTVCNSCFTMYLDNYPFDFNKIRRREIIAKHFAK